MPNRKKAGADSPLHHLERADAAVSRAHGLTAILPCKDLDASEAFYAKLGFTRDAAHENYRILSDGKGGNIHFALSDPMKHSCASGGRRPQP